MLRSILSDDLPRSRWLAVALIGCVAFCLLGPYSYLGGAFALDFGGHRAGAASSGIIDGVGYLGGALAGDSVARISVALGWRGVFAARDFKASWVHLAEALNQVKELAKHVEWGFESVEQYCEQELRISPRTVNKLLSSYQFLAEHEPEAVATRDEDPRSRPEVLETLFKNAIDHGASRLCICDTVGHATPDGIFNLIRFTRRVIDSTGAKSPSGRPSALTLVMMELEGVMPVVLTRAAPGVAGQSPWVVTPVK